MSRVKRNPVFGFQTRYWTNRAVQPQKMVRGLIFRFEEVKGWYYCSENKGADQLRDYRAGDLRLCFSICKKQVSHGAVYVYTDLQKKRHIDLSCKTGINKYT